MSESKRVAKNFINFSIGPVINVLIGILSVPITTRLLLPAENGKAALFSTIEGIWRYFLLLGFNYALVRLFHESKDKNKLALHSIFLPFIFWFFMVSLGSIFYREISGYIFRVESYPLYLLLAGTLLIDIFLTLSSTLIRMQEKARTFSLLGIFLRVSSFVLTICYLLFVDRTFYAIIFGYFCSHLLQAIVLFILTRKFWKFQRIDKGYLRKLLIMVLPLVPADLISKLASGMDKWMLKELVGDYEVGIYNSGFKFVNLFDILVATFSSFWLPMALRWYKEKRDVSYYKQISRSATYIVSIALILLILLRNVLVLYLGEAYRSSATFLPVLLMVPYFQIMNIFSSTGVHISKKTKNIFLITLISTVVNFLGNIILIPRLNSLGASISTAVSMFVTWQCYALFSRISWKSLESVRQMITVSLLVLFVSAVTIGQSHEILLSLMVIVVLTVINWKDIVYITKLLYNIAMGKIRKKKTGE